MRTRDKCYFVLLLFIVLTCFKESYSQENYIIDSLRNLLVNHKSDTNKVNLLNQISYEYLKSDTIQSYAYINDAITLAKELNYEEGIAASYTNLGYISTINAKYSDAILHYSKSLEIYKSINNPKQVAFCYLNIASSYYYLSEYGECIEYSANAYKLFKNINYSLGIAKVYTMQGNTYMKLGDYPKSLNLYMDALKIYKTLNKPAEFAECYNNIAIINKASNNLSLALKYYNMAKDCNVKFHNDKGLATNYNNIGNIYFMKNDFIRAKENFEMSLALFNKIGFQNGIAATKDNLGELFLKQNNPTLALKYYDEALALKNKISDIQGVAYTLEKIAEVYLSITELEKAKEFALKSLTISNEIKSFPIINKNYNILYEISEKEEDLKNALTYFKLYKQTSDSLLGYNKTREIENIKNRLEIDKRNDKIMILSQKYQIEQSENYQKRYIIIIVSVILILIVIMSVLLISRQRIKIENKNLENEKISKELNFRKIEVTNLASQIIEKNDLINKVINEINKIKDDNYLSSTRVLRNSIKLINLNKSRENFYIQAEELHKDFFLKLSEKFPDLTKNEKKLAALILMDLSSKDIAIIMNISSQSVDKNRYRLRKKMKVDTNHNLTDFIKNI